MLDLTPVPQAGLHRRLDRRLRALGGDVRDVPLPDPLHAGRARLLAAGGRAALPAADACSRSSSPRSPARSPTESRSRLLLGIGLMLVGVGLLLMHGITVDPPSWTTLLRRLHRRRHRHRHHQPGHRLGRDRRRAEPARAGMASGINSTFRQVGIATGVAALGAVFQSRIDLEARRAAAAGARGLRRSGRLGRPRSRRSRACRRRPRSRRQGGPRRRRRLRQRPQRDPPDRRDRRLRRRALGFALVRSSDFVRRRAGQGDAGAEPVPAAEQRPRRRWHGRRASASVPGRIRPRPALSSTSMLHELRIENLLLIERAELRLGEGLNAITGETGAGKTVLAHSLDLLMGGKARPQIVRPGAEEAWVEGVFDLPAGPASTTRSWPRSPSGCRPSARRSCSAGGSAGGRTSAFVAGRSATAADLRAARRAPARLLRPARAPQADARLGPAGDPRRLRRRRAPRAPRALPRGPPRGPGGSQRELAELREREGTRERDLDLMRFELSEIEELAPDPQERAELGAERERLRHAEGLRDRRGSERARGADRGRGATAAAPRRRSRRRRVGRWTARPGVDARLDATRRAGRRRSRSSSPTSAASCAPTPRVSRPTRSAWRRSRSGSKRSTG